MNDVNVLIIEDNIDLARDARREIQDVFTDSCDIKVTVDIETDFDAGFMRFQQRGADVVILDVRRDASGDLMEDDTAGCLVYKKIRAARFAPVVFWTALPNSVKEEEMFPLVTVVSKYEIENLPRAIMNAVQSQAVDIIRDIERNVADVIREHMWAELAPNWNEYVEDGDLEGVSQVLLTRLARVLEADREARLTSRPSYRYIYPPISESRLPGDILRRETDDTWWVILTPACDLENNKVGYLLLASAKPLGEHPKYKRWIAARSNGKWKELCQDVLGSTRGRYHFLPAFRGVPDLVIDLEDVRTEVGGEFSGYHPVASLTSPFAEALLVQHSHHRGRIGVPDLNLNLLKERLDNDFAL